jgi:hypothetical protein
VLEDGGRTGLAETVMLEGFFLRFLEELFEGVELGAVDS